MIYKIGEKLESCSIEDIKNREIKYVANISKEEFIANNSFDMGIDLELDDSATQIQVNYDSLTGCFVIPKFGELQPQRGVETVAFAIDERGIAFINDDGVAQRIIDRIVASKRWKFPSLERFIYDFLEGIVSGDLLILEKYEKEMDAMEDQILEGNLENIMERLVDIRGELLDYRTHYEQLVDIGQELEENENNFFNSKNLRFFRLYIERIERLLSIVASLKEHTMQVRDLYDSQLESKQNKKMTFLTIVAAIFTPLTLITGWYGMNFQYMPELSKPWAYPVVIGICVTIIMGSLIFFKKNKWF